MERTSMPQRGVVVHTLAQLDDNRAQAVQKLLARDKHLQTLMALILPPRGYRSISRDREAFTAEVNAIQETLRRKWRLKVFEVDWQDIQSEVAWTAHEVVYNKVVREQLEGTPGEYLLAELAELRSALPDDEFVSL